MNIHLRKEQPGDYKRVFELIELAFREMEHADGDEPFLVERLRKSASFIPDLSIVAEQNEEIVGHILLSKVKIIAETQAFETLSLAPVSVLPEYQRMGIGSQLIRHAHEKAMEKDFSSVLLVGHESYYPRFGYVPASRFGIKFPFDAPDINCMAVELKYGALKGIEGMVEFPAEFFGSQETFPNP